MYIPPPPAADVIRPAITYFLGCWDIAICFDFMLQGVRFAQIAHYTALYENDALLLRAFVAGLSIITTAKTAQGLAFLWTINVDHFMDVVAAISFTTSWMSSLDLLLVSAIAFFVQLFFCIRLWWISKNPYIVLLIVALFVFALIAVFIFMLADNSMRVTWFPLYLGTALAADALLCGSTIFFLLRSHEVGLPGGYLQALLSIVNGLESQSAAPAVVCALIALVAGLVWDRTTPSAYIMVAIIANHMLPKAYAISAMWTLNSRKKICRAHLIGPQSSSTTAGHQTPSDLELSSFWISYVESDSIEAQMQNSTTLDEERKRSVTTAGTRSS
ncbi:hypothetical protein MVEN_01433400 [Mycena venus]|uniref:DUF6534 domain-containing protein n=1 Tax=Mycena venus TaxID=2733690 RepID=A0A8H6XXS7_9AGAR|nr:hypothetical protein MVEN_01433400 [Mycena venus]